MRSAVALAAEHVALRHDPEVDERVLLEHRVATFSAIAEEHDRNRRRDEAAAARAIAAQAERDLAGRASVDLLCRTGQHRLCGGCGCGHHQHPAGRGR